MPADSTINTVNMGSTTPHLHGEIGATGRLPAHARNARFLGTAVTL
jgi:hypothetical protein